MTERFAPIAKETFARMPDVQCIAYTIGQYWCDEAEDAVHEAIVTFLEREPKWPQDFDQEADEARKDKVFADLKFGFHDFIYRWPCLDENTSGITAFASHCAEEGDQEAPIDETHVVYAWARRAAGGEVAIDVVGTMLRPEWEDRFDVGFTAELEEEDAQPGVDPRKPPAHQTPPPAPRGFWAFLRRLFGG